MPNTIASNSATTGVERIFPGIWKIRRGGNWPDYFLVESGGKDLPRQLAEFKTRMLAAAGGQA